MKKIKMIGFALGFGYMAFCLLAMSSCTKSGVPSCEDDNVKSSVIKIFFNKFKNHYADVEIAHYIYNTNLDIVQTDKARFQSHSSHEFQQYHIGMGFDALKTSLDADTRTTPGSGANHIVNLFILKDNIDQIANISPRDYTLSGISGTSTENGIITRVCVADIIHKKTGRKIGSVTYTAQYKSNRLRIEVTEGTALGTNGKPIPEFEKLFP
ncbi:MAG: hypothetical protein P4L55_17160 [Syntrophobacteraceae bacterium]|nr:hypothetical protein [Syntrophobacteraceae bacterium]